MFIKGLIGIVLAVGIGVGCRCFGIPLPGPQAILGAFLAVAMATGYTVTDKILTAPRGPTATLGPRAMGQSQPVLPQSD